MYEDYMQDFFNYPMNNYQNTYDQNPEFYQYGYNLNRNQYGYDYNPYYSNSNYQKRGISNNEIEELYPEIYKVIYPMVKKVCANNYRTVTSESIEQMVEEVYSNVEANNGIELNITLNNEVRGEKGNKTDVKKEDRAYGKNSGLLDIIKILVLREILGNQCRRPNCRPEPRPPFHPYPPRPPFRR